MHKVRYNLRNVSNGDFLLNTKRIQVNLSQPLFYPVTPSPAEVLPLLIQMEELHAKIMGGHTGYIPQRNELRKTVHSMVSRQCSSVNSLAGGDIKTLDESGFEFCKMRRPRPIPEQVRGVDAVNGNNSGDVELKFRKPRYADSYIVQMSIDNEDDWKTVATTSKRKLMLYDIPEREYAYFRIAALNKRGMGEWSAPIRLLVGR